MTEGLTLEKNWTLRYEIRYEEVVKYKLSCMLKLKKIHEELIHIIYVL